MKCAINPSVITLTTDFGLEDEYVGVMKGVILGINPEVKIIDISHYVNPQDVKWASFLVFYSYKYFSKGTIHVVVVDPGVGSERDIICVKANGHIFLCPDNGIITKVVENVNPKGIYLVKNEKYFLSCISDTFHGRDIFAPVAAHLSIGRPFTNVGPKIKEIKRIKLPGIKKTARSIKGEIMHIDRFGNIVTNIEKNIISEIESNYEFIKVEVAEVNVKIKGIKKSYQEVKVGQLLSVIGSRELLEISKNKGNAAKFLEAKTGMTVKVSII